MNGVMSFLIKYQIRKGPATYSGIRTRWGKVVTNITPVLQSRINQSGTIVLLNRSSETHTKRRR